MCKITFKIYGEGKTMRQPAQPVKNFSWVCEVRNGKNENFYGEKCYVFLTKNTRHNISKVRIEFAYYSKYLGTSKLINVKNNNVDFSHKGNEVN